MDDLRIQKMAVGFNRVFVEMNKKTIVTVISWMLILLFLYAAFNKLMDYEKFKVQLGQSPILTAFAGQIAWLVPGLEILIAVLLVFPRTLLLGLFASFGLMVMFSAYILVILNLSIYVPCSCGGILEKMGWTAHFIFNMVFVSLALCGLLITINHFEQVVN